MSIKWQQPKLISVAAILFFLRNVMYLIRMLSVISGTTNDKQLLS